MDGFTIETNIEFPKNLYKHLDSVIAEDDVMIQIHDTFARLINPWVPMDEGVLSQSAQIAADGITYPGPYAHYQYIGEVYGPNIPIIQDGEVVGWFSPPGEKKHPTGKAIIYQKEKHPLASNYWDEAAWPTIKEDFENEVQRILKRKIQEMFG